MSGAGIDADGLVHVRSPVPGIFGVCYVAAQSGGIAADTCKSMLSFALTAQASGRTMFFYLDTSDPQNQDMTTSGEAGYCHGGNYNWHFRRPYFMESY